MSYYVRRRCKTHLIYSKNSLEELSSTVVFFKTVPILKLAPNPLRTPSEPPQNMIFFQNLHCVLIRTPPEPPQNPPRMDFQFEIRILQVIF